MKKNRKNIFAIEKSEQPIGVEDLITKHKKEKKQVVFNVRLDREQRNKFKAVAAEQGKSYSSILVNFIEDYVKNFEQEKEKKKGG